MYTGIVVSFIIALTCWLKRKEWFSEFYKTPLPTIAKKSTPKEQPASVAEIPLPASKKSNKGKIIGIISLIIFIALILLSVVYGVFVIYNHFISTDNSKPEVVKVGKVKTLYRFSDNWDKIIRKTLNSDAEFYPKGGVVKITAPSGKFWLDEPGTAIPRPVENPGEFVFSIPKGSKAWGVEIWN